MSIEEILLILNALVYSKQVYNRVEEVSIYELIQKEGIKKPEDLVATQEEWDALLLTIKQNKNDFSKIEIVDMEEVDGKQKNVAFINKQTNEVYVVFKGTGALEWRDNALGGLLMTTVTPQQQNAVEYSNQIIEKYKSYDIIVSGHSKGGNKAQVVAILCEEVKKAYSFSGQGMGKGFLIEYRNEIAKNKHKITSISNRSDFVNTLFQSIAGEVMFTQNEKDLLDWLVEAEYETAMHQHSPLTMFKCEAGVLKMRSLDQVEQDPTAIFLGNMVDYFREHMTEDDFKMFSTLIMQMFETKKDEQEPFQIDEIPSDFWVRLLQHILTFGDELSVRKIDIALLLNNVHVFIPDDLIVKKIIVTLKLFSGIRGVTSLMTGEKASKKQLHGMVMEYNTSYQSVQSAKTIVRDFSSTAQAAMKECFGTDLDEQRLSLPSIIGWDYVADVLFETDAYENHANVEKLVRELLHTNLMTEAIYRKIIDDVYEADRNAAKDIQSKTRQIQIYRSYFQNDG